MYTKTNLKKSIIYIAIFLITGLAGNRLAYADRAKDFTLIVDAGHGGNDIGASENGINEKDINLSVARLFAEMVKKKMKDVNVVMTRDKDTFISLQERASIANRNRGNLFVSIHTNSVDTKNPNRKNVTGASVYALGLHKDQDNLKVAQRENSVIELENDYQQKYSGFDPTKDESYIIFEMAQKKNLGQSLKFANLAQKELVKTAGRADRGVKQAGFWVLWATSMPSVLVELDFICNPQSAAYMSSAKGQKELAEALFKAFEHYMTNSNKKNSADTAAGTVSVTPVTQDSNEYTDAPALLTAKKSERNDAPPVPAVSSKTTASNTPRRRRSLAAKEISEKRVVETASIPFDVEKQYLSTDNTDQETVKNKVEQENISKSKKGKKEKNKQKKTNSKSHHSKIGKISTIYKIQILASADELQPNDPRFRGLTPVKAFKENNLYKYTYGESSNKQDMEKMLISVKKLIPDAFIIARSR